MARATLQATLGSSLGDGQYGSSGNLGTPVTSAVSTSAAATNGTLRTDVAAAVAVLVADGASPTQAHVNTLNTAWGLLNTSIQATATAASAADTTGSNNAELSVDNAVVTSLNAFKAILAALLRAATSSGKFTP